MFHWGLHTGSASFASTKALAGFRVQAFRAARRGNNWGGQSAQTAPGFWLTAFLRAFFHVGDAVHDDGRGKGRDNDVLLARSDGSACLPLVHPVASASAVPNNNNNNHNNTTDNSKRSKKFMRTH